MNKVEGAVYWLHCLRYRGLRWKYADLFETTKAGMTPEQKTLADCLWKYKFEGYV